MKIGQDPHGVLVRAKPGLAGCEYLSESRLVKDGTVIMGVISDMLRRHGYTEWEKEKSVGSMIGASYDWRITPDQLEERNGFFSEMMHQDPPPLP